MAEYAIVRSLNTPEFEAGMLPRSKLPPACATLPQLSHSSGTALRAAVADEACVLNPRNGWVCRDVIDLIQRQLNRGRLQLLVTGGFTMRTSPHTTSSKMWLVSQQAAGDQPQWTEIAPPPGTVRPSVARCACASLGDEILITGGYTAVGWGRGSTAAVEWLRPHGSDGPRQVPWLLHPRAKHTATTLSGSNTVVVVGGPGQPAIEVLAHNRHGVFAHAGALSASRYAHAAASPFGAPTSVLVAGGMVRGSATKSAEKLDVGADGQAVLSPLPSLPVALADCRGASLADGAFYVCSTAPPPGSTDHLSKDEDLPLVRLDARTSAWQSLSPLPRGRRDHAFVAIDDATLVVLGGYGRADAMEYDRRCDAWQARTELAIPIELHDFGIVNCAN